MTEPFRLPAGHCDNDDEVESRRRWLPESGLFIDIGAADGAWSVAAAMRGCEVIAIDCNPNTRLDENAKAYGATGVFLLAFVYRDTGTANINGEDVASVTLDYLALSENWGTVDFVKIDVEGYELDVLHGMQGVLVRDRPDLVIEVHIGTVPERPVTVESVKEFLDDFGYRFEVMDCVHDGKPYAFLYATAKETQ